MTTREITLDSLVSFLRGGGRVGLQEWLSLPDDIRAGLEAAGRQVAAVDILALATALKDADGFASIMAELDGGRMKAQIAMEEEVASVIAEDRQNGVRL